MPCEGGKTGCPKPATLAVRTDNADHGTGFACADHAHDMVDGLLEDDPDYDAIHLERLMPDIAAALDGPLGAVSAASTGAGTGPTDGAGRVQGGMGATTDTAGTGRSANGNG